MVTRESFARRSLNWYRCVTTSSLATYREEMEPICSEETRELPGERDNARNNTRCTQARKATHGLDGQHQDVDRTLRGRVNQNDGGEGQMEKVRPWCGQPSDRGRLKNRAEHNCFYHYGACGHAIIACMR